MMDKSQRPLLLKPIKAAALLDMSKSKLYDAMARGEVPSVRVAGVLRVPLAAIESLINEQLEKGGTDDGGV